MTCANCGHALNNKFCPNCGQKPLSPKDLSVKHFVEETFEGLVHFDNKYFRTLKMLFSKPGQLSVDYVAGRRSMFMKPIQFFLVTNLVFFIFIIGNPYSLSLYNYLTYRPFTDFNTRQLVHDKIAHMGLSRGNYTYIFDEVMKSDSKELIFVFIPLYAILLAVLFLAYRRKFVEHLIFATHFVAFILCWFFLESYLIDWPFHFFTKIDYSQLFDSLTSLLTSIVVAGYFAIATRRFYQSKVVWSVFTGLIIGGSFFYIIQVYRMLLFYKIIFL